MEDVNKRRLNFLSLFELEYGSYEFGSKEFACVCKLVEVIAKEIERTQIHFLNDVLEAVTVVVSYTFYCVLG